MRRRFEERDINIVAVLLAIVFWILTISWMVFIFYMSSESGPESTERSSKILEYLKNLSIFPELTEVIIRKSAHVLEYALLTVLSFFAIKFTNEVSPETSYSQTPVKIIKSDNEMYIVISLWMAAVYAAIDEYHQLFVSGRNGSIYDFLIDMAGSIIVLCIIRLVFTIYLRRHGQSEIRYE